MKVKPPPWTLAEQESAANVLTAALEEIDRRTDWGHAADGRRRLPCPEQPLLLLGAPLGQYHCPVCVEMQIAGIAHLPPDEFYELMTGHDWPPGYEQENPE